MQNKKSNDKESTEFVEVKIFGESYKLVSKSGGEIIKEIAKNVDETMNRIAKNVPDYSPLQVAILTALNIMGDLRQLQDKEEDAKRRIEAIINKINDVS